MFLADSVRRKKEVVVVEGNCVCEREVITEISEQKKKRVKNGRNEEGRK